MTQVAKQAVADGRAGARIEAGGKPLRLPASRLWLHLVLLTIAAIWALPLVDGFVTSLRPMRDVMSSGWWSVFSSGNLTFENYAAAWRQARVGEAFFNSLMVTLPSNAILVASATVTAYTFARMNFFGKNFALASLVGLMLIPPQVAIYPVFSLFQALGITGTLPAVWIFQAAYSMPFSIFVLLVFFDSIPKQVLEASVMDGATPLQEFLHVALPLARPGILSIFILHFVSCWNDLLIPLIFAPAQAAPLTVRIATLMQAVAADPIAVVVAAAFISVLASLVVFLALQRYFVRGITGGAVKE